MASKIKNSLYTWIFAMVVTLCLSENSVGENFSYQWNESGKIESSITEGTKEITFAYQYDASDYAIVPNRIATSGGSGFGARIPYSDLNKAIKNIHTSLPNPGSFAILPKNAVSMRQLRTLTKHTGDEYSLFTLKGQRLVIRGNNGIVDVSPQMYKDLIGGKYGKFSGHTHPPGHSLIDGPGDAPFLRDLGQKRSGIWGDDGVNLFDRGFPWNIGD